MMEKNSDLTIIMDSIYDKKAFVFISTGQCLKFKKIKK